MGSTAVMTSRQKQFWWVQVRPGTCLKKHVADAAPQMSSRVSVLGSVLGSVVPTAAALFFT